MKERIEKKPQSRERGSGKSPLKKALGGQDVTGREAVECVGAVVNVQGARIGEALNRRWGLEIGVPGG